MSTAYFPVSKYYMTNIHMEKTSNNDSVVNMKSLEISNKLQSCTKYLRLTLVFMCNSALREKFNSCFSRVFC